MKFYNRDSELADLQRIEQLSYNNAQMTFIVGRRRVGKTKLLLEATKNSPNFRTRIAQRSRIGRDFEEMSRNFNEIGTRNPQ